MAVTYDKAYKVLAQQENISNSKAKELIDRGVVKVGDQKVLIARGEIRTDTKFNIKEIGKIKVIFEDNHIIVVEKPVNIPSQEDKTGDIDMISIIKDYLKEKYNKPGNVYLGLVHRLDRPVGGVMIFAKTSKAAARLSEQVREKIFKKTYLVIANGKFEKQKRNT